MRMLPAELGPDPTTTSEARVFTALAAGRLPGTALHSLNLPTHRYKLTAELDFLLILDDLILVVEVKGAQISCTDGVWTYWDRTGHHRQSREGPFKQAESGMYALRDRLRKRIGAEIDSVAFGYLVVTPDIDLPRSSFTWDDANYCGRGPFTRDFIRAVTDSARHWNSRQHGMRPINRELHQRLLQELRPSFDYSPLLEARADALDAAMVRLTDEQFSRLDLVSEAPRVLCTGGAGTGKTFLAAEIARRQALLGRTVLFVCRSAILASFVRTFLADSAVTVCEATALPENTRFDVVVIDEGQDLMTFPSLSRLEDAIVGGWAIGRWVIFLDHNRQAHLYGDYDPDALEYIRSFHPVPAGLRSNCRNTREIVFQTRAVTGADTGVAAAGSGPLVQFAPVNSPAEETAALEAHLRHLREQEVPPGAVTIVSLRGAWETSAVQGLRENRRGRIRRLDEATAAAWPVPETTWTSAIDIKGLENRFVCVIDIDALDTETQIDLLYVALSRPRAGLWVAISPAIADRMRELNQQHAAAALHALEQDTP